MTCQHSKSPVLRMAGALDQQVANRIFIFVDSPDRDGVAAFINDDAASSSSRRLPRPPSGGGQAPKWSAGARASRLHGPTCLSSHSSASSSKAKTDKQSLGTCLLRISLCWHSSGQQICLRLDCTMFIVQLCVQCAYSCNNDGHPIAIYICIGRHLQKQKALL